MTRSSAKRFNSSARKIAAQITLPLGASVAFGPTEARAFALASKIIVPSETNLAYLAELLNRRMVKRFPGKSRAFEPYPSPQFNGSLLDVYHEPNHDFVRPRREPPIEDRYLASRFDRPTEQW